MKHTKAVWQRIDCGCQARVSRRGLSERTQIAFCPFHRAAGEMLEALKTMARTPYCHDGQEHRLSCPRCSKILKIEAVIAKAEEK